MKEKNTNADTPASPRLTKREKEIIEDMIAGRPAKAIASKHCISICTVKRHKQNMMEKTGCTCAQQLVAWYVRKKTG